MKTSTPRTDAATYAIIGYPHETQPFEVVMKREAGDSVVDSSFARQLETELAEAIHERKFDPAICECPKGHHFRTTPNTPAKSEGEWECPHCAVIDRDRLKAELAAVTAERNALLKRVCPTCKGYGVIGGHIGQTPETFDYWDDDCPDCNPSGVHKQILEAQAQLVQMREALKGAQEYFKDRMDADHDGSRFVGNVEMKHYQAIAEALATFKSKHPSA